MLLKRILLPIAVIVIAIVVFIALKQSKPEKTVRQQPEKIWRVNTVAVEFQTIAPETTLYGRVETPRIATLKSALVADVLSVSALEGDEVTAGQVLVQLDDTDARLLLEQRKADLAEISASITSEQQRFNRDKSLLEQQKELLRLAEQSVLRSKKLEQTRLASQVTLDDAIAVKQRQIITLKGLEFDIAEHPARLAQIEARKQRAEALLEQAEVDLSRTQIVAPFDGRISSLTVSVGDRLRTGDSILVIYDIHSLEVRAQIPGRYLEQVSQMMSQGSPLVATTKDSEQPYSLKLNRLSGEVKVDSGGIDALFRFDMDSVKTLPVLGTFIELALSLASQQQVVAMPSNALYGLDHIYILKDGYMQAIGIERVGEYVDADGKTLLLIRSDLLQPGDQIVTTQLPNAITGLRVEALSE